MATHTLAEVSTGHLGETVEMLGNPTGNQKTPRRGWPPKTSANGFPWKCSANHSLKYHGIPRRKTQWMVGLYTHKNWASHLKVIQQFGELQGCILMDG